MRRLAAFLAVAVAFAPASAQDLSARLGAVMPAELAGRLLDKGFAQNTVYRVKGAAPSMAPDLDLAREALGFWDGDEPAFFNETLYLYRKPAEKEGEPGAETRRISAILRSLSRLEGIEYYSTSRKKMRTLYEKSYIVDNEKSQKRIADPVGGSADGLSVLALQKDLTFGEFIYRYDYRETPDAAAFYSRNLEPLSYLIFDLIDEERLRASLIVRDMGDCLLIYSLTRVDFLAVPGIEGKIHASFTTRAQAMYNWFIKEYER